MGRYYRVGEVATLTRVSVRTLHHYDRIGLLRPALHSTGGYRLYGETDLLRLQQILTLRYLGFPLKRIGELLDRTDFDLVASLRVQRRVLRERIEELESISAAVGEGLQLESIGLSRKGTRREANCLPPWPGYEWRDARPSPVHGAFVEAAGRL